MPILAPYRRLLARPGAAAFSAAAFVARMPIAMLAVGTVLLVEGTRGSYALAGAVVAVEGTVSAVANPALARLVDRLGQSRLLVPLAAVRAGALLGLIVISGSDAPAWTLFPLAAAAGGASLPVGSLVRARWSHLLAGGRADRAEGAGEAAAADRSALHTAFALESVLDEVIFVIGPLVVTVLATHVHPAGGLLVALTMSLTGSLALGAQRATEPPAGKGAGLGGLGVARVPGVVVLSLVFAGLGGLFGSVDIATIALSEARGVPAAAGPLLALLAAGSLVSGLAYGAVSWRSSPTRRFLAAVGALALATLALPFAGSVPALGVALFVTGLAVSPSIVSGYALAERLVPASRLTEGLTWTLTGLNLGYSAATAASGAVVEAAGASRGFVVTTACGLASLAVAVTGARWLVRAPGAVPGPT